jgi:hypothetical protein
VQPERPSDLGLDPALAARLARLLGSEPLSARPVTAGYSPARRSIVTLEDGRSVFVKSATADWTHDALLVEGRVYESVRGDFIPERIAFDPESPAVLILEDLSGARWPPPWEDGDVTAVLTALAGVHEATPPEGLPRLAEVVSYRTTWSAVASDPAPFLSLGLASEEWLRAALPVLVEAQRQAALDGNALVHQDVRSDNIALSDGRARLVDWNWAAIGSSDMDLAFWLPSLAAEGGPLPGTFFHGDPRLTAVVSGWFAANAGLPPPPGAPRVREVQRTQLQQALPWAAQTLGLPPLDR